MKTVMITLALLVSTSAFAQVEVVEKYRNQYPTPLSSDQKVDLLRHVAVDVHGGLLVKPEGASCGGYACDIICFSDAVLFDVLQDQDMAAIPRWNQTSNPRAYKCELVAGQSPPVVPQPVPVSVSLTPELLRQAVREGTQYLYDQHERSFAYENVQRDQQTATLKAAIDAPAWYAKVFGNTAVQLALVGLGTWATTYQVMK